MNLSGPQLLGALCVVAVALYTALQILGKKFFSDFEKFQGDVLGKLESIRKELVENAIRWKEAETLRRDIDTLRIDLSDVKKYQRDEHARIGKHDDRIRDLWIYNKRDPSELDD